MTTPRSRAARLPGALTALAIAVTAVTACGGDDDDAQSPAPTATDAPRNTTADTSPTPGSTASGGEEAPPAPADADDDAGDDVCTADRVGGSITVGTSSFARGLDPGVNLGSVVAGGAEIGAIYDTLLRFNPETGEYGPHIATGFEGNEDSTQWTVTLRDDVTFSNGDPLDAEAVRASIERMKSGTASSAGLAQQITTIDVVDPHTVVFTLSDPYGTFPYVLSEEVGMIVNPAIAESMDPDEFNLTAPLGSGAGPYVVERFVNNEEIVLRARDDYWGGPVCIQQIRFVHVPGNDARIDAFTNGELDMAILSDARVIGEAIEAGVPGYGQRAGLGIMIALNHADPEISDVRVRRAMAHAIDHEALNQRAFDGYNEGTSALMPADSPIYGGPGLEYDPDLAAELLAAAKADGFDGSLRIIGGNEPALQEVLITVEAMLEAVGFDIEIEALEPAEVNRRIITEKSYQGGLYGPVSHEESIVNDFIQFLSDSPSNRLQIADPEFDALINDLIAATNRAETKAAMEAIQPYWNDQVPAVHLFTTDWWVAVDPAVRGITWTRDVTPMFHTAYLDE